MVRPPCCDENGLKKGPWTPEEDQKLQKYIERHGHGSWRALPRLAGLNRCGKSCRLRWTNYLRPDIKRGKFSEEEEQTILHLHSILGNKWSAMAKHLPGRTDNEIKNFWNTHLKKKLIQMGFDPMTHRPRTDFFAVLPQLLALANLRQLAAQQPPPPAADAIQTAKLHYMQYLVQSAATIAAAGAVSPPEFPFNTTADVALSADAPLLANSQDVDLFSSIAGQDELGQICGMQMPTSPAEFCYGEELLGGIGEEEDVIVRAEINAVGGGIPSTILLPETSIPSLSDISIPGAGPGDACSSASCDGCSSPFPWSELVLDDQFLPEFA